MAQKVSIQITDDIDGSEDAETVSFGFDGAQYEIDLSPKNRDKMLKALDPYLNAARKASGGSGKRNKRGSGTASKSDAAEVRVWAHANGHEVPDRGRIPANVREAYDAAHA